MAKGEPKKKRWGAELPVSRIKAWDDFAETKYVKWKAIHGALDLFQAAPPELRDIVLDGGMKAAAKWFKAHSDGFTLAELRATFPTREQLAADLARALTEKHDSQEPGRIPKGGQSVAVAGGKR